MKVIPIRADVDETAMSVLREQLTDLTAEGPRIELELRAFVEATRSKFGAYTLHDVLDLVNVVRTDGNEMQYMETPPFDEDAGDDPGPPYIERSQSPATIRVAHRVGLRWHQDDIFSEAIHVLIDLRKKIGKQVISGRGHSRGELLGTSHVEGTGSAEFPRLSEVALRAAVFQIMAGSNTPQWIAMNYGDQLDLMGSYGILPNSWGLPIIATDQVPSGTFVVGDYAHAATLRLQSVAISIGAPIQLGQRPVVAETFGALAHHQPTAFLVATYREGPKLLDLDKMVHGNLSDEEAAAFDRAIREGRGR